MKKYMNGSNIVIGFITIILVTMLISYFRAINYIMGIAAVLIGIGMALIIFKDIKNKSNIKKEKI